MEKNTPIIYTFIGVKKHHFIQQSVKLHPIIQRGRKITPLTQHGVNLYLRSNVGVNLHLFNFVGCKIAPFENKRHCIVFEIRNVFEKVQKIEVCFYFLF